MRTHWVFALAAVAALAFAGTVQGASTDIAVRSVKGEFKDVKERVVQAIEERGLVLNYTARIGAMLERTGKDIGAAQRIYKDAELFEFCSAAVSRGAMEADPRHIVYCPYGIAVYTLPKTPGQVYVAYRKLAASAAGQSQKALAAVDKLLADIVASALK